MNNIIVGKMLAKWNEDKERRSIAKKSIDFYHYVQKGYLEDEIDEKYTTAANRKSLKQCAYTYPLTDEIIDELSQLFRNPATFTVEQENLQEMFSELVETSQLNSILDDVDHYENLTFKTAVIPVYRNDKIELDIITSDRIIIDHDIKDPNKITTLWYELGSAESSPAKIGNIHTYVKWTNEQQSLIDFDDNTGQEANERDEVPNEYGYIPIVFFGKKALSTFWPIKESKIIAGNEIVNEELTNVRLALKYQTQSTLVTTDTDIDETMDMGIGAQARIDLKSTGDFQAKAEYVNPTPPLEKVWSIVNDIKKQTAGSMGISSEASKDVQYDSGYKLKLSKQGVINYNTQKQNYFRPQTKQLIRVMMDTWNLSPNTTQYPEPKNIVIHINFGELKFENDPLETEQLRAIKTANGTWSPIMSLMQDDPDLDEQEAEEKYKLIKQQNSITGIVSEVDLADAIEK